MATHYKNFLENTDFDSKHYRLSQVSDDTLLKSQETLADILRLRASATPNKTAYIYLRDGENDEQILTYGQLDLEARKVAAALQAERCKDKRILLMYPQGLDFIIAFFGCVYAGAVSVLLYPPTNARLAKRMERIITDCSVFRILTNSETSSQLLRVLENKLADDRDSPKTGRLGSIPHILSDRIAADRHLSYREELISADDLAFLQYTSGSTGVPKGVMVTHGNVIANQKAINHFFGHNSASCTVSWLPMLHDMGLIGSTLQPIYVGYPLVFMSPLHFMQKPVRWLQAITKYRATSSGGPNFAFDYCVNKISETDKQSLDLSSWKVAFNGSESVRDDTMKRFSKAFDKCGLDEKALIGVYGMAETTLLVTGRQPGCIAPVDETTGYLSSGRVAPFHVMKIVDPSKLTELENGRVGEIWVRGPSVTKGYWGHPEMNRETFQAKLPGDSECYLRTGDMGFIRDGHVFVTGRLKDLIIIKGRNYHAEDLEWTLQGIAGLMDGFVATFLENENDPDSLTVVAGVSTFNNVHHRTICETVSSRIIEDYQLPVNRIVLIKPKSLPKTTSGKIQRRLTRELLQKDRLQIVFDQRYDDRRALCSGARNSAPSDRDKPRNEAEIALANIWSEVLGIDKNNIGVRDNFFSLGGHSLMMLELANRLDVSLELLFKYPTIDSFLNRSDEYKFPNVENDIWLPPSALDGKARKPSNVSLITGANGLFGFHFLTAMLNRSSDRFVCLVRGRSDDEVRDKFLKTARYYQLENTIDMSRITLLKGDFGQHRLGLSDEQYNELADSVQNIYHIGSHVNNWLPYEGIKDINVEGTRRLLTLAMTGRGKRFHYASTSTFCPDKDDKAVFSEADNICKEDINKYNGYDISKYVSEQLCLLARQRGVECNIYRLVWVGGQSKSGLSKINDGFNIMLRILITLGIFPKGNYLHDVIPVDLMADAMASVQSKASNVAFNVTSQSNESVDLLKIVGMLRDMGYRLTEVSRAEFVKRLKEFPDHLWDEHCRSYRQLVIRLFDEEVKPESFYDSSQLKQHLDSDIRQRLEQKFVETWFHKAVLFLVRNNALPTPSGGDFQSDKEQIARWNDTAIGYPSDRCIHHIFEAQAAKTPDATALVFDDQAMTYGELNGLANAYARHLLANGLRPENLVGICLERSVDLYAVILGVLKAGGAYVPLCPSYPREVIEHMLRDSGAKFVFTSEQTRDITEGLLENKRRIKVQDIASQIRRSNPDNLSAAEASPSAGNLAYVIYTSGTTGKAKGVMVEHRSVINHNVSLAKRFELTPKDNILQFATMNFDSFVEEVFPIFSVGGSLTIIRDRDRLNVDKLKSIIKQCKVTVLKFPTAFWHSVAEQSFGGLGVRLVGIGGEEADVRKYRAWIKTNPGIPVINTYGPTEITITATTVNFITEHALRARLPIGTPINNTKIHILDDQLEPLPIGGVGELYIAGDGLARGYMNRDEETRRAFVRSENFPGERLYKTGDLARWTEAGEIEFFGRNDNQVKVRGYRIELGAIESVLNDHPAVKNAAVILKTVHSEKRIIAFAVAADAELSPRTLKNHLREKLPAYMTPDAINLLPSLPMNCNGKVDRAELEAMELSLENGIAHASPPESELHARMLRIWQNLLGAERIGIDDDFLNVGGHSLLAIHLLQRVYQEFGVKLSIDNLYSNLTVRALCEFLSSCSESATEKSGVIEFPALNDAIPTSKPVAPLFLFHGVGGNLATFFPLARQIKQQALADRQIEPPLYGLQVNAMSPERFESCEQMVDAYVEHITGIQPNGPYSLAGWSYGSSIAFLVGEELARRGERIENYISIDAEAPARHSDFARFLEANHIGSAEALYADENFSEAVKLFGGKFGFTPGKAGNLKLQLSAFLGYPTALSQADRDQFNLLAVTNMFIAKGFAPGHLTVTNALLLHASESRFSNYRSRWNEILSARQVVEQRLEGDHWSIMSANETAVLIGRLLTATRSQSDAISSDDKWSNSRIDNQVAPLNKAVNQ